MSDLPTYRDCIFCGPEHPFGLKLKLRYEYGMVVTELSVGASFHGYENVVHGGIVSGIFDEVMWWAVTVGVRQITATRKLEVEFLKPMHCETVYRVRAGVKERRPRLFLASGEIEDPSNGLVARASGLFMPIKNTAGRREELVAALDLTRLSPEMAAVFSTLLASPPP
jgi:acyl-coenzyme A thioesterase PaaI-like protein